MRLKIVPSKVPDLEECFSRIHEGRSVSRAQFQRCLKLISGLYPSTELPKESPEVDQRLRRQIWVGLTSGLYRPAIHDLLLNHISFFGKLDQIDLGSPQAQSCGVPVR